MISKSMNKLLRHIPRAPAKISFKELSDKKLMDINLLDALVAEAMDCKYIAYSFPCPQHLTINTPLCLTEAGQIELEEYKGQKSASAKATWALIIAGLSFLASVAAIIVACVVK